MSEHFDEGELDDIPENGTAITRRETVPAVAHEQSVTPAQAKIEAVANLTLSCYSQASTLQLTPDESRRLAADFPDEAFLPGAGGKANLIYIEHACLRDRLNEVFGIGQVALIPRSRWTEEFVTPKGSKGIRVYVEAMMVIRGCFVAEAIGDMDYYPNNNSQNFGDAVEGAKSAALRRCCKELGVGLQAWKKSWCDGWWQRRNARNQKPQPATPQAKPEPSKFATPTDPPAQPHRTTINSQEWAKLQETLRDAKIDVVWFLMHHNVARGSQITLKQFDDLHTRLSHYQHLYSTTIIPEEDLPGDAYEGPQNQPEEVAV